MFSDVQLRAGARLISLACLGGVMLVGCGSDDQSASQAPQPASAPASLVPEPTEESIALANAVNDSEQLPAEQIQTGEEVFSDRWVVAESLREVKELDQCQQATLEFMETATGSTAPAALATFTQEEHLDENSASEQLEIVVVTDPDAHNVSAHAEAQRNMDESCLYKDTVTEDSETSGEHGTIAVRQIVISDFLTARTAELQTEDVWVRYMSTYPPSIDVLSLDEDSLDTWSEQAVLRVDEAYSLGESLTTE